MASKPSFDPNEMSGHLTPEAEQRLLADRYHPLHDKTLAETYYPGSTFKPVSAISALEDRLITPDDKTKCHGSFEIARRRFKCTKTHGVVSLYDAIVQSCNVYFYELGARPGMMDRLAKYGADLGLGAPTGLGLNGEDGGFLPTEEWYREQKRQNPKAEGFQVGQALNAVIGQGSTRVTLLQMALLYAAIANGGKLWLPQIVERVESPDGQTLEEFAPRVRREISVAPETLAIVRQALVGVVNETKGTAYKSRSKEIEVAGKTGTAQVHGRHTELGGYEAGDHAWFVGFAPAGRPRIAVAVLVEHGGHGGDVAAPVAMEIIDKYFETVAPADREAPHVGLPRRHKNASSQAPAARRPRRRQRHDADAGGRLAPAALPVRLDAHAVGGGGRPRSASSTFGAPSTTASRTSSRSRSPGSGSGWRSSSASPRSTTGPSAATPTCFTASAWRCCSACSCSERWSAAAGAGSTWARSTSSRRS